MNAREAVEPLPFTDLRAQYLALHDSIQARMQRVLDHGQYIMGPGGRRNWRRDWPTSSARGTASAWPAAPRRLLIAMMALDLKPGDEVITTPFTFAATAETIVLLGAKPVFVDVEPDTCLIDATLIESRITRAHARDHAGQPVRPGGRHGGDQRHRRTARPGGHRGCRAELRRHLPGPAQLRLEHLGCDELLPEQAAGLLRRRRRAVHRRRCAGAGGARDPRAWPERALHPQPRRCRRAARHLQAAVLLAKLERFEWELQRRRELGARYTQRLAGLPGCRRWPCATIATASGASTRSSSRTAPRCRLHCSRSGIPTAVHYPKPLHHQAAYAAYCCPECCPVSQAVADRVLSLPMSADLSPSDQDRVIDALAHALSR